METEAMTVELSSSPGRWQRTRYGEWVCDGVGVVVSLQGRLWLGYSTDGKRLGPFLTMPQAALALEAYRR
jgi:hypothetical protein